MRSLQIRETLRKQLAALVEESQHVNAVPPEDYVFVTSIEITSLNTYLGMLKALQQSISIDDITDQVQYELPAAAQLDVMGCAVLLAREVLQENHLQIASFCCIISMMLKGIHVWGYNSVLIPFMDRLVMCGKSALVRGGRRSDWS